MAYRINWGNTVFLILTPFLGIAAVVFSIFQYGFSFWDLGIFFFMYFLVGMSVTGGYHRYFSHRSYECRVWLQWAYAIFGAAAFQNSILKWSSDHRIHHRYVDSEDDPYNIHKGFFWAHMGWVLFDQVNPMEPHFENAKDLKKKLVVRLQHKYYLIFAVFGTVIIPFVLGLAFDRFWPMLIWGVLVRIPVLHHSTFLINSAAHTFGKRAFSSQNTARDNYWLGIFTFGEGYHNFHHAFPSDYRNGLRWYDWDSTKWMIRTLAILKQAWNLKVPGKFI